MKRWSGRWSPVLEAMEREGILVDRAVLAKLSDEFANGQGKIEAQIHELAGERFNIGSPKQLGDILFGRMGLPGGRKTATGAWSTDSDMLEDLAAQGIELARRVVDWRQLSKLRSTYTDALPNYINPNYRPGAHELCDGRHLHRPPVIVRSQSAEHSGAHRGGPPHPHRLHRALRHQAHQRRLQPDRTSRAGPCRRYSAAEEGLCRRARYSCDDGERNVWRADRRHGQRGAPARQGDQFRHHLWHFGLWPGQPVVDQPRGSGRLYQDLFQAASPAFKTYMDETKKFARDKGYVETIFGRRCHFPRINSPNASERAFMERAAINAPIQGAAADIIRRAMIRMQEALDAANLSAKMLLQVHDELIFETRDEEIEATMKVVKHVMEKAPEPAVKLTVPLQVDARAAMNWDEAH